MPHAGDRSADCLHSDNDGHEWQSASGEVPSNLRNRQTGVAPPADPPSPNGDIQMQPPSPNGDFRTPSPLPNGDFRTPSPLPNGDFRTPSPLPNGDFRTPS